jgi:hypothetical protein
VCKGQIDDGGCDRDEMKIENYDLLLSRQSWAVALFSAVCSTSVIVCFCFCHAPKARESMSHIPSEVLVASKSGD